MKNTESAIKSAMKNIEAELVKLAHAVAMDTEEHVREQVRSGLATFMDGPKPLKVAKAKPAPHANGLKPAPKPKGKPKLKPAGASKADVTALAAKLFAHINANPDQNAEAIAKGTELTTADLKAPIKLLLKEKKIKAHGAARGTRYQAIAG
jgi:hypothetical protein